MKLGISRNHDCIHETQLSVVININIFGMMVNNLSPPNITGFHSVMVIISVFESGDPSSILGETSFWFFCRIGGVEIGLLLLS
jgi:hypothetical protein